MEEGGNGDGRRLSPVVGGVAGGVTGGVSRGVPATKLRSRRDGLLRRGMTDMSTNAVKRSYLDPLAQKRQGEVTDQLRKVAPTMRGLPHACGRSGDLVATEAAEGQS